MNYDPHPELSTSQRLAANILATVDEGLTDAGMPLTDEQRAFFAAATGAMAA